MHLASSSSSSGPDGDPARWSASRAFRNTWQKVSDVDLSGSLARVVDRAGDVADSTLQKITSAADGFEQRHFEGDLLSSVARSLGSPGQRWRYSPADGWPIDSRAVPAIDATRTNHRLEAGDHFWVAEERPSTDGSGVLFLRLADGRGWLFDQKPGVGVLCVRAAPEAAAYPSLMGATMSSSSSASAEAWQRAAGVSDDGLTAEDRELKWLEGEVVRLQEDGECEQERHRGRVAAIRALEEALPRLRTELAEAAVWRASSGDGHSASELRAQALERAYLELQEKHHVLLSCRAKQGAELQRHAVEARDAEAAEFVRAGVVAAGGAAAAAAAREWARDGPETEALKTGKVELAEALGLVDEVRLQSRKELRALQAQVEAAHLENEALRRSGEAYVAPQGSIVKSFRRLFCVAAGKADPFPNAEDAVI